jgi:macrolide transport system ATP-binding/permease protein
MKRLRLFWNRLSGTLFHARREGELASEIENHIAWQTEDNIRAGMSPEQARHAALVKFGGLESVREEYRDQRGIPQIETFLQDLRFAFRSFAKRPGFFAVIVLSLAFGIGLNTTIFTWLKAVYLNPLPAVANARQLVTISAAYSFGEGYSDSYSDFQYIRDHTHLFSGIFAHEMLMLAVSDGKSAQMAVGGIVTGNYFDVLGSKAEVGRTFQPEEDQVLDRNPVVVLSDRLWHNRFGADPNIGGKQIQLNGIPFTVIGVAPLDFVGAYGGLRQDFWVPLHMARALDSAHKDNLSNGSMGLQITGRPTPGTSISAIQSELDVFAAQLRTSTHKDDKVFRLLADPLHQAQRGFHSALFEVVRIIGAVVAILLLLACLNTANLLLGRATERSRETSIRISLGAGRGRIVRQLLTESFVIATVASVAGLLTVFATRPLLNLLTPPGWEMYLNMGIDWRVLCFLCATAALTSLIFGLWPAIETTKVNVADSLKEGSGNITAGRRRNLLRKSLVIGQVALAMTALFGAALFALNFRSKINVDRGFDSKNILTTGTDLFAAGINQNRGRIFYQECAQRLNALPGVQSVAWTTFLPMSGSGGGNDRGAEVRGYTPPDGKPLSIVVDTISPDYLKTLGIPLVQGREFAWSDTPNATPVLIVNQQFVTQYLHGRDPLGAQVRVGDVWRSIVGINKNYVYRDPAQTQKPTIFLPITQDYTTSAILVLKTKGEPLQMASEVRREIMAFDRNIPVGTFITMEENVASHFASDKLGSLAMMIFALVASVLAAIGIYAVLAAYINQRRREFAIRIALGALPGDVRKQVLWESARMALIGSGIGMVLSVALGKVIESELFNLGPFDLRLSVATAVAMAVIATLSTIAPAHKASNMDTIGALRSE